MPISIKKQSTEDAARKLAALTGETITDAIHAAVTEKYNRILRERSGRSLAAELNEIALRCASRPIISGLNDDDILGYDEFGAPTR